MLPHNSRALLIGVLAQLLLAGTSVGAASIRYNRDIRPILSDTCFQCHGPDKAQRKGKLRLDVREDALEKKAFIPGNADESELIKRILTADPEEQMPPPEIHKALSAEQKQKLKQWVAEGAVYEAHWAYLPIERPPVPEGGASQDPVDAFVGVRLAQAHLERSAEADRHTLLRRLSLDLTGLPPSPAEVQAFAGDSSPDAYERQVERLLASPHFGERMAVPWLDAVRFADTVGYHGDQNQRIFPYRDYVIDAFNANKSFAEFTLEQLAGDLLPNPTPEQRVATGFNRLNMMTREGGAQPREYLAKYQADRVRTISTTWLGATMACCECHDHKFDPFTTRDFYAMSAFFADLQQWGVYSDYDYTPNPDLKGWSNDHPFPPEVSVESPYLHQRIQKLNEDQRRVETTATARLKGDDASMSTFGAWRREVSEFLRENPKGWFTGPVSAVEIGDGTNVVSTPPPWELLPDGSVQFASERPTKDRITCSPPATWIAALQLELLPGNTNGSILRNSEKTGLVQLTATLKRSGTTNDEDLKFTYAEAGAGEPSYSNGQEILGIQGGWRTSIAGVLQPQAGVWLMEGPWHANTGDVLSVTLPRNVTARVRISFSPLPLLPSHDPVAELRASLENDESAFDWYHRGSAWNTNVLRQLRSLDAEIRECGGGRAWTMVTVATNAVVTRVLPRGNWMDESGAVVSPAPPHFLPPFPAATTAVAGATTDGRAEAGAGVAEAREPARLTRLDLARWLVSKENPLTARNFANRVWAQFLGTGISARIEDLGYQGEWPTHPELLDWLAAEFMQPSVAASRLEAFPTPHGWDVKHLVRLIVNSATYRLDTVPSVRARELDPDNKLLSHQSPRRLDAEFVRDNALAIAGLIDLDVGGPSAFPYQPPGYYANIQFPDRDYVPDKDLRQYRRGVYMHWQRTFLHPMLANFDAQSREECVAARLTSNTPQQALTLLNDPTFVEAGRALAEGVLQAASSDEARLNQMYERALLRDPTPAERESLSRFLAEQRQTYTQNPDDATRIDAIGIAPKNSNLPSAEVASWANVARVVLNLHETLTRY